MEGRGFLKGRRVRAATWSPEGKSASVSDKVSDSCNNISSSVISEIKPTGSHFKIRVVLEGRNRSALVAAMVDCGATTLFISERFVRENRVRTRPLGRKIRLCNIDGSENRVGNISRSARLQLRVGENSAWEEFMVTDLGPEDVVLGLPWLRKMNPEIDWSEGTLNMREESQRKTEQVAATRVQRRRWWKAKILEDPSERLWCVAGFTYSTELAEKANKEKPKRTFEEIVPEDYRQYADVFSKRSLNDYQSIGPAITQST
jgi:Retroviral aspartyl protease